MRFFFIDFEYVVPDVLDPFERVPANIAVIEFRCHHIFPHLSAPSDDLELRRRDLALSCVAGKKRIPAIVSTSPLLLDLFDDAVVPADLF
ncbi:MAG: hypothetical protein ACYC5H_06550 [Methylovirgula sp.]